MSLESTKLTQAIRMIQDEWVREAILIVSEESLKRDTETIKLMNGLVEKCTQLTECTDKILDKLIHLEEEMKELKAINGKVN